MMQGLVFYAPRRRGRNRARLRRMEVAVLSVNDMT